MTNCDKNIPDSVFFSFLLFVQQITYVVKYHMQYERICSHVRLLYAYSMMYMYVIHYVLKDVNFEFPGPGFGVPGLLIQFDF